jgi:hypothetical protein
MGKFAEFCKGKTMGAFLLLLLAAGLPLGHHSLVPLGDHPSEQFPAAAWDPVGVHQQRFRHPDQQLPQPRPPPGERFLQKGSPAQGEKIEEHVRDDRRGRSGPQALVSAQEG